MKSTTRKNRWSKRNDARNNTRGGLSRKDYAEKKAAQYPTLSNRKDANMLPKLKVVQKGEQKQAEPVQNVDTRVKFQVEFTMRPMKHVGVVYTAYIWANSEAEVYAKMVNRYGNDLRDVTMFDPRKQTGVTFEICPLREMVQDYKLAFARQAI